MRDKKIIHIYYNLDYYSKEQVSIPSDLSAE